MMPIFSPPLVTGLVAVLVSLLQVVVARWRDLGPITTGICAMALVWSLPTPSALVLGVVACAMLLASVAWGRGGRRGVGRPGLTGLVIGVSTALIVAAEHAPVELPPQDLRRGSLAAIALLTLFVGGIALMRASAGFPPPRWTGEIPVQGPASDAEEREGTGTVDG